MFNLVNPRKVFWGGESCLYYGGGNKNPKKVGLPKIEVGPRKIQESIL
jgi:hypothetical protein